MTCGERKNIKKSRNIMTMTVDVMMPKYNLMEYSDNYLKKSECLWQSCKDDLDDNMTGSESLKYKSELLIYKLRFPTNYMGFANVP